MKLQSMQGDRILRNLPIMANQSVAVERAGQAEKHFARVFIY
jgi:hypothetical protein